MEKSNLKGKLIPFKHFIQVITGPNGEPNLNDREWLTMPLHNNKGTVLVLDSFFANPVSRYSESFPHSKEIKDSEDMAFFLYCRLLTPNGKCVAKTKPVNIKGSFLKELGIVKHNFYYDFENKNYKNRSDLMKKLIEHVEEKWQIEYSIE